MLNNIVFYILIVTVNAHSHHSHYIHIYDGTTQLYKQNIIDIVEQSHMTFVKSDYYTKCYYRYNLNNNNNIIIYLQNNTRDILIDAIPISNNSNVDSFINYYCYKTYVDESNIIFILIIIIFICCCYCGLNCHDLHYYRYSRYSLM